MFANVIQNLKLILNVKNPIILNHKLWLKATSENAITKSPKQNISSTTIIINLPSIRETATN